MILLFTYDSCCTRIQETYKSKHVELMKCIVGRLGNLVMKKGYIKLCGMWLHYSKQECKVQSAKINFLLMSENLFVAVTAFELEAGLVPNGHKL